MEEQHSNTGLFSWVEVTSSNLADSLIFYSQVFGWSFEVDTKPLPSFRKNGKAVAGMNLNKQFDNNTWFAYVAVENLDETIEKVRANGGNLLAEPTELLDYGRSALCADSNGIAFGIRQHNRQFGVELVDEPNTLVWTELATNDMAASQEFYCNVFGWTTEAVEGTRYVEFLSQGKPACGMTKLSRKKSRQALAGWSVFFGVENLAIAIETTKLRGGNVLFVDKKRSGEFGSVTDSAGAGMNLVQL